MQIQVFMGSAGTIGTYKLQEIYKESIAGGKIPAFINAAIFGEYGLMDVLEAQAVDGQREILVDFCTRTQIQQVLEWRSCVEHDPSFDDLVIYLARWE